MLRKTLFVGLCCVMHYNFAGNTSSYQEEASLAKVMGGINNSEPVTVRINYVAAITNSSNVALTRSKMLAAAKFRYEAAVARTVNYRDPDEIKNSAEILALLQKSEIEKN